MTSQYASDPGHPAFIRAIVTDAAAARWTVAW